MSTKVQPNVVVTKSRRLKEWIEKKQQDYDRLDASFLGPLREREVSFVSSVTALSSSASSEKPKKQAPLITMEDAAERVLSFLTSRRREEEENEEHGDTDREDQEDENSRDDDDEVDEDSNNDDDDSDDDDDDVNSDEITNIVWFSENSFLSNSKKISRWWSQPSHSSGNNNMIIIIQSLLFYCAVGLEPRWWSDDSNKSHEEETPWKEKPHKTYRVYFYQLVLVVPRVETTTTTPPLALASSSSSSVNATEEQLLVDSFLRLLSRLKRAIKITFLNAKKKEKKESLDEVSRSTEPVTVLPASLAALEEFVSQAVGPRTLVFSSRVPLFNHQWRAILRNCNKHVKIRLSDWQQEQHAGVGGGDAGTALIEAMNLNECPTKLDLAMLSTLPDEMFHAFVKALGEKSKSLVELCIRDLSLASNVYAYDSKEIHLNLIVDAVSRNCGLKKFEIIYSKNRLSDDDWKTLMTKVVASHPKLEIIHLILPRPLPSAWRDQVLISSLRLNTVLWGLVLHSYNQQRVNRAIIPILTLNRFRPVAQAVKQETNAIQRGHLFTTTLIRVCRDCGASPNKTYLPRLYYLLRENPDLLARYSNPQDVLMKLWHKSMSRLISWEERMLTRGMDIPTRLTVMPVRTRNSQDEEETNETKKVKYS